EISYKIFISLDWFFLIAPKGTSFSTSDNPFSLIPGKNHSPNSGVGYLSPNSEKTFPLSPKITLMMINKGNRMEFRNINKEMTRSINCRSVLNCKNYAIARDEALIKKLIKITKINETGRQSRFKLQFPLLSRR